MNALRMGARLATGVAALALSMSAGAVTVTLVGDANPDQLQVVISGLGGSAATADVSAFDIGLNFGGLTLTSANMGLNTGVLDDGSGSYASTAIGSDGSCTLGGFASACPSSTPGGVTADLAFTSFLSDATLAGLQNPGASSNFSLTLATLTFSGAVLPSQVTLAWGDGFHDVKGAAVCDVPASGGLGNACVIYPGAAPSVPEPGTLALLGFGVLAGAATLRRRRAA